MTHIEIYPAFSPMYYSYFIGGLYELFGRESVRFSAEEFPDFGHNCLALRIRKRAGSRNIFIHASDEPTIPADGLRWCDTMGKVNVDAASLPQPLRDKVVNLGPIFPYRVWDGVSAVSLGVRMSMAIKFRLGYKSDVPASYPAFVALPLRSILHLSQFVRIGFQRLPLEAYSPGTSRKDYIFFSSAIWPETHEVADYGEANRASNRARFDFVRACQSIPGMRFEGGLFMRSRYKVPGHKGVAASKNISHRDYIAKTQASCVAFNTPSVKWCHSWKLGEYLAFGKAIISLPLVRDLPGPLDHGVHVHYVDGSVDGIREALSLISTNHEYRRHLERNAREYHERYLRPSTMMRRLLDADAGRAAAHPRPDTRMAR